MTRYVTMYAAWLAGVLAMAAIAIAWYKRVEEIGVEELGDRLFATEDTEDTGTEPRNRPHIIDEDPAA